MGVDYMALVGLTIQLLGFLIGGSYFIWQIKSSVAVIVTEQMAIKYQLAKMEVSVERLGLAAVEIARQDERLNAIDTRMQELSNRITQHHPLPQTPAQKRIGRKTS